MSKRNNKTRVQALYRSVVNTASNTAKENREEWDDDESSMTHDAASVPDALLRSDLFRPVLEDQKQQPAQCVRMKKFRSQLLHQWMIEHVQKCRVADIGGGKGLVTYLLQQSGWSATVIDPVHQELPTKYRSLASKKQIRIARTERVPHIDREFTPDLAESFDLLIAVHAHGCNLQIIDAAALYRRDFILLPCCIIGEPAYPLPGIHWLQFVADYAVQKGFAIRAFQLNFKGQSIALYGTTAGARADRQSDRIPSPA